jgi:tetratricopeptide (TPR) repeat protein
MGAKNTKVSRVVVMPDNKRTGKRRLLIILFLVVAVATVATVAWLAIRATTSKPTAKVTESSQDKAYKKVLTQSDQYNRERNFTEKAQSLESYLATNPAKEQQVAPTQQLASAYLNSGQYQKAVDTFGKLAEMDPNFAISAYQGQAAAYAKLGNNQAAIEAHKKVISLLRSKGDDKFTARITMEEQSIQQLGGSI